MNDNNSLFSERMGYVDKKMLALEELDQEARTGIWNALHTSFIGQAIHRRASTAELNRVFSELFLNVANRICIEVYKRPVHREHPTHEDRRDVMHGWVNSAPWNRVFDLIECLLSTIHSCHSPIAMLVALDLDQALIREGVPYRVIANKIIAITNEVEVREIEAAVSINGFPAARGHIEKAITYFSNREKPDYGKTVVESIHAVEAIAKHIVGDSNATCGAALTKMGKEDQYHPALLKGFSALYGFTSQMPDGRHGNNATGDGSKPPNAALARYFLVSCSAFVNYLQQEMESTA